MKKYHVKVLTPYEFFVDAENFEDAMCQAMQELPSNYNGDGITICSVNEHDNKNIYTSDSKGQL